MTKKELDSNIYLIAMFMKEKRWLEDVDNNLSPYTTFNYHESWDLLMPVIEKINNISKGHNFIIYKTYVGLTVDKDNKFYKDFHFAYSEYFTSEQTSKMAAFKLIINYLRWEEKNINEIVM